MKICQIGLVGAGTIGGGVIKILNKQKEFFNNGLGLPLKLKRIVDINTELFEKLPVGDTICSANVDDIIDDNDISIVIELVGGTTFAKDLVIKAFNAGKHVVTANKALVSEHGPELFESAEKNGVSLFFEASVGGGMPAIKTIRESMIANEILSVETIINGTCNYILSQMTKKGLSFETVLEKAQENGYAEADPTLDIGGGDSGHKVSIMASLLYGGYVPFENVHIEGITTITGEDIEFAKTLGYTIKLLGIIKKTENGEIDIRVHPAMLHNNHILASVSDVFNAVCVKGDVVGDILLYGRGAGEMPTASAVVSDVIDIARNIDANSPKRIPMNYYCSANELKVAPITSISSRYYLRFSVSDEPKVFAAIASVLGEHSISIASVTQNEGHQDEFVPVIILTHEAVEKNLQNAIKEIEKQSFIKNKTQIIRIEE